MRRIVDAQIAKSAIDTSDGLLACAQLMAESSQVGIELFPHELAQHVDPDVQELGAALDVDPWIFALNAGHDWEVVFTVAPQDRGRLDPFLRIRKSGYPDIAIIGRVVESSDWSGGAVRLSDAAGDHLGQIGYFTDEKFVASPAGSRTRQWIDFASEVSRVLGELQPETVGTIPKGVSGGRQSAPNSGGRSRQTRTSQVAPAIARHPRYELVGVCDDAPDLLQSHLLRPNSSSGVVPMHPNWSNSSPMPWSLLRAIEVTSK